jgi:ethanolamine utilization protein EutA
LIPNIFENLMMNPVPPHSSLPLPLTQNLERDLALHDDLEPHSHLTEEEQAALADMMWRLDNVEFTTVGIDVGSSTSHLMFSRVHLRRRKNHLSSRYVVINREVIWSSPVRFTPFLDDETIDAQALGQYFNEAYEAAGIQRQDVDTGAIILTGEAVKRRNAKAIAELFSEEGGKFVCATAGHRLECALAAHGSGAAALSKTIGRPVLNIDIGGGTTKFALCEDGRVASVSAIAIGARLLALDESGLIIRLDEPARLIIQPLGLELALGEKAKKEELQKLVAEFVRLLIGCIRQNPPDTHTSSLMLTEAIEGKIDFDLSFSGGVSEYIYGREHRSFGDLALSIAHELYGALLDRGYTIHDPGQGIRATAIGASQFTIQVSGRTIYLSNKDILPLHNLPVIRPPYLSEAEIDSAALAEQICHARARMDLESGQALALAIGFSGSPEYQRLRAIAEAIHHACADSAGEPLVLIVDNDVGRLLGRLISDEFPLHRSLVCIDGIELDEFDFIDVGRKVPTAQVVPVVVKSLLFNSQER